jgi:hypothetical protein
MTGILEQIDRSLADDTVSPDAVRWTSDGAGETCSRGHQRPAPRPCPNSVQSTCIVVDFSIDAEPHPVPQGASTHFAAPAAGWYRYGVTWHLDPAGPAAAGAFDRFLQRQILVAFGVTARQIGLEGPSFLDARYRQRQRNRRKRR